MTRDNQKRLSMFAGTPILVQRLALNYSQVEELDLPPNPAKMSDSRAKDYVEQYGKQSWELDALSPSYIHKLIDDAVRRIRDDAKWEAMVAEETDDLRALDDMISEIGGSDLNE